MKKAVLGLMVALVATALVATDALAAAKAADKKGGEKKGGGSMVSGQLSVTKNDKGEVTGVTITTKSGTIYTVSGYDPATVGALDNQEVTTSGEVKDDNGKMSIIVKGDIKKKAEKKEGDKKGGEKKGGKKK
jgi:hypothetical protein